MLSFTAWGCRVRLGFSFFILLAFSNLFAGIQNGAYLLLSVFLHEFCHLLAMLLCGRRPQEAAVSALGIRIQLGSGEGLTYSQSIAVSLAGPMSNLLLALAAWLACGVSSPLFLMNLTLEAMHLLPIEPLDGGLALKSLLSCFLEPEKAGKISFSLSILFLFPLAVLGFLILLQTRYNFSLLALSLYLMLYLVLKKGTLSF